VHNVSEKFTESEAVNHMKGVQKFL